VSTRRQFITLLGGAAALPVAARAQQLDRVRRISVLLSTAEDDSESKARLSAFVRELHRLGWSSPGQMQIERRSAAGRADLARQYATELVGLAPDVILASGGSVLGPLLQATSAIPIVFTLTPDPVGAGFVHSLARPGGNATGFTSYEYGLSGKWLELLKHLAPDLRRAGVLRDPVIASGPGQFGAIQAVAPSFGVEAVPLNVRGGAEIETGVAEFARSPKGGLIVTGSALAVVHRDLIIAAADRHALPSVYFQRLFVPAGGLVSYGPDFIDQYRRAAGYVDRILRGQRPAELPVQEPTKFELVINLKTAKALGLEIPPTLLARADEVIE
jgi:putative tryptophan/tyrosine transport system substrate-binding protein